MTALAIVVAVAENGVIGRDNQLPWRLKTDLRHFRELTIGRPVIMGHKTWDSIGRPLPGRESIVLSRDAAFRIAGARTVTGWDEARAAADELAAGMGADTVAVIGGAAIFRFALPECDRLHLTLVHARPSGDVTFPPYDPSDFTETGSAAHPASPDDEHPFTFVDLVRRPAVALQG